VRPEELPPHQRPTQVWDGASMHALMDIGNTQRKEANAQRAELLKLAQQRAEKERYALPVAAIIAAAVIVLLVAVLGILAGMVLFL
jgi:hypothetical protein